jgi:uncharacterized protein YndB with AHSA1/START domain
MADSTFIYVTYIKTTPDKLWEALTTPEFSTRYWLGARLVADWRQGGAWTLTLPDGRRADEGEVEAFEPKSKIALRWRHVMTPDLATEPGALCTMELEPQDDAVKLTVTHTSPKEGSKLIQAVSGGWPKILSNLKSLLESGQVVVERKG